MTGGDYAVTSAHVETVLTKCSILFGIVGMLLVVCVVILLYMFIRSHQLERAIDFHEAVQFDQIDYLIALLDEQEGILENKLVESKVGPMDQEMLRNIARYLDLRDEFSEQLNRLHEMMVGETKKNEFDLKAMGSRKKG